MEPTRQTPPGEYRVASPNCSIIVSISDGTATVSAVEGVDSQWFCVSVLLKEPIAVGRAGVMTRCRNDAGGLDVIQLGRIESVDPV
ncbi:hypothetical protein ABIB15_003086 [Marisediminicola sp. UYEF4]|uniref:hypothetical protein n=1 Tax=Marisediminicola sp. UYEF4 TaxID=1756384 RepID=UPI0033973B60